MPYSDTRHRLIDLLKQLGVAVLYALLAKFVIAFFSGNGVVSIVWPSSGLALAVLLIGGKRYFWSVFLGAFLANAMTGITLMAAVAIATGNTLEALVSVWLLTHNRKFDTTLQSLRSYLLLILAGSIGSIGGALNGATTLLFAGFLTSETYLTNLAHWWMGDVLGIALITPLILVCWQTKNDWHGAKRVAEAALLLGLTFLVGQIIFLGWFHDNIGNLARGAWLFLLITWVALRLGVRGIVIAVLMMAVQALWGAYHGIGYFANDIAKTQLVNYWIYMLVLSVNGMALATFISGQKLSEEALRRSETKFRTLYDSNTDAVHLLDEAGFIDCNEATLAMCGCATKEEFCSKSPVDFSPPGQPCGTSSLVLANQHIATAKEKGSHRFDWVSKRLDNGKLFHIDIQLTAMELDGKLVFLVVARDITERKAVEKELQESKNQLQATLDAIPDLLFEVGFDGHIYDYHSPHTELLAAPPEFFLGKKLSDVLPRNVASVCMSAISEAHERGYSAGKQYALQLAHGTSWFELSISRKLPHATREPRFIALARDITDRKRVMGALLENKEMLKRAQSIAHIGYFKYNPSNGNVDGSDELFRIFGLTREQFQFSDFVNSVHPEDRAFDVATIESAIERKAGYEIEHRLLLRDGTLKWVRVIGQIDTTLPNKQLLVIGTVQDITGHKHIEEELKLTKERYDFATAIGKVGTWDWSPVTGELMWSDETFRLMGFKPGSLTPSYELYLNMVHPGDREFLNSAVQAALHDKKPYNLDCRIILDSGKQVICHVAGKVEFDATNQPIRMLGTIQDITERKAAERQLHDLAAHILNVREDEKTRIAREIHDELGSTLTALKIDAYWLSRKLPLYDKTTALAERVNSMLQRMDVAINATRRIIDNMRPAVLDDLGLLAAIEWLAEDFHMHTGIECRVSCIEDEANLDKQRSIALFRILQEALTNVSRHSGASRVEIEFLHNENEAILAVSDNGRGIAENHMTTSKSYGMLGMTERVEQLGGKIIFGSPQGGGFSVKVTLPSPAGERSIQ